MIPVPVRIAYATRAAALPFVFAFACAVGAGCAGEGQGGFGGNPGPDPALNFAIAQRDIFTPRCALAGCHDAVSRANDLDLSDAATSHAELVNVNSLCADRVRVTPNDTATSYLLAKLGAGNDEPCGSVMPLGFPPLSADEIELLTVWIDGGAPPAPAAALVADDAGADNAETTSTTLAPSATVTSTSTSTSTSTTLR